MVTITCWQQLGEEEMKERDKLGVGMKEGGGHGHGEGNLVETYELHKINSKPKFCPPQSRTRTTAYSACVLVLGVWLLSGP
jgi:hypothetical protein